MPTTVSLRVLIVDHDAATAARIQEQLETQDDLTIVGAVSGGLEAVQRAADCQPQIALVSMQLADMDGVHATWLLAARQPQLSVIILADDLRPEDMERVLLAGAQGYAAKSPQAIRDLPDLIRSVWERALERRTVLSHLPAGAAPTVPSHRGRRVAVFCPKGGQGKTSVAVNLAVYLRTCTRQEVALVDADLRFGDTNVLLDLPYERSIIDLLPHIDALDSDLLRQVFVKHSSGIQVLVRPERPELAETITAAHWTQILSILPSMFDFVVIDCEVSYDERLLSVLDQADAILLVLTPNLSVVRNTRHFLQLAQTLGYQRDKIAFVLNRANSNVGLGASDVEWVLGPGRYFRIDSAGQLLTASFNLGQPAVLTHPRSAFSRSIRDLAEYLRAQFSEAG